MSFAEHIPGLIAHYGLFVVFLIVMLESMGIPMPGETALLSAAIYAGNTHHLSIVWIIIAASAGAIVGDNIGFWVGRRFGLGLLIRHGHYLRLDEAKLKLGQYLFKLHGGKIVFFGRFVAVLRAFAAVLAGANGFDPKLFFLYNAAGGIAWATIFGTVGYLFGKQAEKIVGPIGLSLLAIALIGAFFLWRFYKQHEARLIAEAELALPGPLKERV